MRPDSSPDGWTPERWQQGPGQRRRTMTQFRHLATRTRPLRHAQDLDMNDLFGQMERMFQMPLLHTMAQQRSNGSGQRTFPIDMYETSNEVVLVMAVPGMSSDELDVSLEGRQLTVRGSLPSSTDEEDEERSYWVQGIPRGEFQRIVTVPAGVDAENIQATVE